jgi:ubiquinone/menaquinone biosynthesis C-methylase UbiE
VDLGAGDGTFTLALAERLAPGSFVHAIDRDRSSLDRIPSSHHGVSLGTHVADFSEFPWPVRDIDGILMANSLHYVADQPAFLQRCAAQLPHARRFLIVEYDTDAASPWVPFPVSSRRLATLFTGFVLTPLGRRPSRFRRAELYAALVVAPSSGEATRSIGP